MFKINKVSNQAFHVQIPVPKWSKMKKWENVSRLQNGAIRVLQIGANFRDYNSG